MYYSPLRYPGGKNKLAAFVAKVCTDNNIDGHYVEPYAGGSSVALFLLLENYVNRITINDKDRSIYAFWYSVLNHCEELCQLILRTNIDVENWQIQKEIQRNKAIANLLDLGFSTLFLNRTNRSGIISGGIIGGQSQEGEYKIDCRFNKNEIIRRIKLIADNAHNITLHNEDAIELIDIIENEKDENTIFYFDPPYYLKAEMLYMNHYEHFNHRAVSERISAIQNLKWIVSYDNEDPIKELYSEFETKEYAFFHSAYESRKGKEILFFSDGINQPEIEEYNPVQFKLKRFANRKELIYVPEKTKKIPAI